MSIFQMPYALELVFNIPSLRNYMEHKVSCDMSIDNDQSPSALFFFENN